MTEIWRDDPVELERWFTKLAQTIAVDFDGVLHPYSRGWTGSVPADEPPIDGARTFLEALNAAGLRVVVFSTRADHPEGWTGIENWLRDNDLRQLVDEITHTKPAAIAYVDDRAVTFNVDAEDAWADVMDGIARLRRSRAHGAGTTQ
jgi:hypothetical protein